MKRAGRECEHMVTNLGVVPDGMSFLGATIQSGPLRKYQINPECYTGRLTICETVREIWRIADRIGGPNGDALKELAAAGYDYGKRMDARMRELRGMVASLGGKS